MNLLAPSVGTILPIFLYGAEAWCLTEGMLAKLRRFQITALAVCVESRIATPGSITSPREMSTNASACTTSTHTSLDDTSSGSATSPACPKIDFLDSSLPVGSRRKRLPGCPPFTYGRGVFKSLEKAGLTRDNWYQLAQDRGSWRSLVKRAVHNRTSSAHASPVHSLVAVQTVLGQLVPFQGAARLAP